MIKRISVMVLTLVLMFSVLSVAPVFAADKAKDATAKTTAKKEVSYVASKGGEKYHKSSCRMAENIKPENKIKFKSKAEAEKAGYKPCAICKP